MSKSNFNSQTQDHLWELDRPLIDLSREGLLNFPEGFSLEDNAEENQSHAPAVRQQIIDNFKRVLSDDDAYGINNQFWTWLQTIEFNILLCFYKIVLAKLTTANGYVVDHNPTLLYCTGSHHNMLLLGGTEQASAATFYVSIRAKS